MFTTSDRSRESFFLLEAIYKKIKGHTYHKYTYIYISSSITGLRIVDIYTCMPLSLIFKKKDIGKGGKKKKKGTSNIS